MHSHSSYHATNRLLKAAREAHQCTPGWCPFCMKTCEKPSEGWSAMIHGILAIIMICLITWVAFQAER